MIARIVFMVVAVSTAVSSTVLSGQSPATADWPQWRGPERNGLSRETGLLKQWPSAGPPVVWNAANLGAGYGSEERLRHPDRADRLAQGALERTTRDAADLNAPAADVDEQPVLEGGAVHDPEVAEVGLLLRRQYPDLHALLGERREHCRLIRGLAHSARRRHHDLVDAGRAAERGVSVDRRGSAQDGLGLQLTVVHAGREPDRFPDLVGQGESTPRTRPEHHEPEAVRAEIDDRDTVLAALARFGRYPRHDDLAAAPPLGPGSE